MAYYLLDISLQLKTVLKFIQSKNLKIIYLLILRVTSMSIQIISKISGGSRISHWGTPMSDAGTFGLKRISATEDTLTWLFPLQSQWRILLQYECRIHFQCAYRIN